MRRVDVAVVGAGPAGLAAAVAAARAGMRVLLLDEQAEPGGQVWRGAARTLADPAARAAFGDGYSGAAAALAGLEASGVETAAGAVVVDVGPEEAEGRALRWLARDAPRLRETRARALVLATGAMERPVPFPGWELPGVMGVGALQLALKQGVTPPGPVVIAGRGPLALLTVAQLRRAGAPPALRLHWSPVWPGVAALRAAGSAVDDPALYARGLKLALARGGVPLRRRARRLRAIGGDRLEAVTFEIDGRRETLPCAWLGVHDGVIANVQLSRLMDLPHVWSEAEAAWRPATEADGRAARDVWIAGDGAGVGGAELAGLSGTLAGLAAAQALGAPADAAQAARLRRTIARKRRARRLLEALHPPLPAGALADDETMLCRCEGVTVGAARRAVEEGADGPNRVKAATRCGMGACQGRMCGPALTRLIAGWTGRAPAQIGALRVRPPLKPVRLGDLIEADAVEAGPLEARR